MLHFWVLLGSTSPPPFELWCSFLPTLLAVFRVNRALVGVRTYTANMSRLRRVLLVHGNGNMADRYREAYS